MDILARKKSHKPKRRYGKGKSLNRTPKGFYTHGKKALRNVESSR